MNHKSIAVLLFTSFTLSNCQYKHKSHHKVVPKLEVSNPIRRDTIITRAYVCQIHASRHIELRALEKGYLQKVFVDEGQNVIKGQPMFKIMPNVYEADLQKAQSEAEIAQIEYKNTKSLADKKIVPKNELASAKAKLNKAQAEVKIAQTYLDFTKINAPFHGIMDHLFVREGSLLEEGELLTKISDNSKMWVYFNLPEAEYLDYIMNNKKKQEKVKLRTANGKIFSYDGVITSIEGEFNNETGTIEFRATFDNPQGILRHGQTGNVLMDIIIQDALIIPQKATFEVLDKHYVFVVTEDNILKQREIKISHELPHLYVVEEGLEESDRVLLEGLRKVYNEEKIEVNLKSPEQVLSDLELYSE